MERGLNQTRVLIRDRKGHTEGKPSEDGGRDSREMRPPRASGWPGRFLPADPQNYERINFGCFKPPS